MEPGSPALQGDSLLSEYPEALLGKSGCFSVNYACTSNMLLTNSKYPVWGSKGYSCHHCFPQLQRGQLIVTLFSAVRRTPLQSKPSLFSQRELRMKPTFETMTVNVKGEPDESTGKRESQAVLPTHPHSRPRKQLGWVSQAMPDQPGAISTQFQSRGQKQLRPLISLLILIHTPSHHRHCRHHHHCTITPRPAPTITILPTSTSSLPPASPPAPSPSPSS